MVDGMQQIEWDIGMLTMINDYSCQYPKRKKVLRFTVLFLLSLYVPVAEAKHVKNGI
jgi:hypothetical protein